MQSIAWSSKVVLGCAMHWYASRRLCLQSWRVEPLTEMLLRQRAWRLLLTVRARLTIPTAGHMGMSASTTDVELRLEVVLVVIPISAEIPRVYHKSFFFHDECFTLKPSISIALATYCRNCIVIEHWLSTHDTYKQPDLGQSICNIHTCESRASCHRLISPALEPVVAVLDAT